MMALARPRSRAPATMTTPVIATMTPVTMRKATARRTTTTSEATASKATTAEERPSGLLWRLGLRARLLGLAIGLLTISTLASLLIQRQVLDTQLDGQVERGLTQEVQEFTRLVGGTDPSTGQPFGGDVAAIFDTFLRRNVFTEGEAAFTFVNGQPYGSSTSPPTNLFADRELTQLWLSTPDPLRGVTAETPAGPVQWLAVPINVDGRRVGTFVAVNFITEERAEVEQRFRVASLVAIVVLVLACLGAWAAMGRGLRPLRRVTEAARRIEENDLSRRIAVQGGGEVADLGRTFNALLDRLERAFGAQRAFLGDAGHEMRTPLTIIRGHLELMGEDPVERRETLDLVMDEIDRMHRLVNDLLTLAKSEQPDCLQPESVDVAVLTREAHARAGPLGDRRWRLAEVAQVSLRADRHRVTQALMQLAENAVQHTQAGDLVEVGSHAG